MRRASHETRFEGGFRGVAAEAIIAIVFEIL